MSEELDNSTPTPEDLAAQLSEQNSSQENTQDPDTIIPDGGDPAIDEAVPVDAVELRQLLVDKAKLLGIRHHPNIGVEKLKAKIEEFEANQDELIAQSEAEKQAAKATPADPENQVKTFSGYNPSIVGKNKDEAFKLIRFKLIVNDPNRQNWTGTPITAGNDIVGTVTRVIPFNADSWHAEAIIVHHLKNVKYQSFPTKQGNNSSMYHDHESGKLVPAYTIIELPPLSEQELEDLKRMQASQGTGRSEDK